MVVKSTAFFASERDRPMPPGKDGLTQLRLQGSESRYQAAQDEEDEDKLLNVVNVGHRNYICLLLI